DIRTNNDDFSTQNADISEDLEGNFNGIQVDQEVDSVTEQEIRPQSPQPTQASQFERLESNDPEPSTRVKLNHP
ncbi:hypothetical protein U1Q18_043848, partial [Sarracenia purpurea var. burkii]